MPPSIASPRNIPLLMLPQHECSYLPDRIAQSRGFFCSRIPGAFYHELMDAGFRRSGRLIYQPACGACRACQPMRVPVERFQPSKSQRRSWRKNQDLIVTHAEPEPTQEKFDLYARYVRDRHGREEDATPEAFTSFLYESPVDTLEFCYRDATGRLLGVGICDVCTRSLSSVYFYFDPAQTRRGLGVFSALHEIEFARGQNIPYYYLGYWIEGCNTMHYKADYRPHEILQPDGVWRELQSGGFSG